MIAEIALISFIIFLIAKKKIAQSTLTINEKEQKIIKTEEKFKTYLEYSPIGVFVVNLQGFYIDVNEAACKITGYTREELLTKNMAELQPPETLAEDLAAFQSMVESGTVRRDFKIVRKDGTYMWAEVNVVKISDNEFICFGANIEERKKAELQILEQTEEIKKQNEQLLIAKAKAEESDRLKTAFLQNMSHEIRTPLNAIMGFAQILPNYFEDKASLARFASIIQHRGDDLLVMINDILHIAKIESGQLTINKENCTLEKICIDITEYFQGIKERLDKNKISLQIDCDKDLLKKGITIDCGKYKQILTNLIHNAFKFTEEGLIAVKISQEQDQLQLSVSDTGIGISKEDQDKIFDRFVQVQSTGKAHIGTGLGLAIVKGLVQLFNGTITLTSEPGKGTTFTVLLPFELAVETNNAASNHHNYIDLSNLHVLVVEDEETNSEYFKILLSKKVATASFAGDADEAFKILKEQHIDIILLDIQLPGISGYEMAKIISKEYPQIYIIAQTAYASSEDKQKALDSGCHDYIAKPVEKDELLQKMSKVKGS